MGNITKAREAVNMDVDTYQALMDNPQYARTVMECLRECAEESIVKMQGNKVALAKGVFDKIVIQIDKDTERLIQEVRDAGRT
tara:strand:+ start:1143 stop:1391 length:249 start_codon:yes stop_codon:yes gene_type:complete